MRPHQIELLRMYLYVTTFYPIDFILTLIFHMIMAVVKEIRINQSQTKKYMYKVRNVPLIIQIHI